jgi:hypothetical protein
MYVEGSELSAAGTLEDDGVVLSREQVLKSQIRATG